MTVLKLHFFPISLTYLSTHFFIERKVTGASFIVLSGALKTSSGLTAKSSIVDDGIMVQVSQDRMMSIRKSLNNMENIKIDCGPVGVDMPDETVHIKWVDADHAVNAG